MISSDNKNRIAISLCLAVIAVGIILIAIPFIIIYISLLIYSLFKHPIFKTITKLITGIRDRLKQNAMKNKDSSYLSFISKKISQFPFTMIFSICSILLIYLYTLKLFALANLFHIDKKFFAQESLDLKLWEGLFVFTQAFGSKSMLCLLFLLLMIFITLTVPAYLIFTLKNSKSTVTLLTNVISYFSITYLAILLFICSLYFFYAASQQISRHIQEQYIHENHYCQILQKGESRTHKLVITENTSVPYQLILAESQIMYFKPNHESSTWKSFESNELKHMKSLCTDYDSNNQKNKKESNPKD